MPVALMQVSAVRAPNGENGRQSVGTAASCGLLPLPMSLQPSERSEIMDKDRIKGTVKQAEGTAKESLGKLTGDKSLEIEGKAKKAEGKIQKAFGKAKDALREG